MGDKISTTTGQDAGEIVAQTLQGLAEFLTGIATTQKSDWARSIGYLLQRIRGGHFLHQLADEIRKYKEAGKISPDYLKSAQSFTCLQELLDFLDNDSPDEIRFKAMKSLFLGIAFENFSNRNDVLPAQLMKLCRSLSSSELLVLSATFQIFLGGEWRAEKSGRVTENTGTTSIWREKVVAASGLQLTELVEIADLSLVEKRILAPHHFGDKSGFRYTEHYRLTSLGYRLCQFINSIELTK